MSLILVLLRVVKVLLKAKGQTDQGISETILPQLCHIPAGSPCMHPMRDIITDSDGLPTGSSACHRLLHLQLQSACLGLSVPELWLEAEEQALPFSPLLGMLGLSRGWEQSSRGPGGFPTNRSCAP